MDLKRFFKLGIICLSIACMQQAVHAQQYSPENPYRPTEEKIEQLKNIIPGFPQTPPMGEHTKFYDEKYMISDYPPGMFKYFLYVPKGYEDQALPTVLLLHGGARHMNGGAEYFKLGLHKTNPAILVIPIAPPGYDWNSAAPLALEALQDAAKHTKMDSQRIYLSGYSMGGIGVYSLLARFPGIFAAGFSACGTYDPKLVNGIDKDVSLLIWHGQKDMTFPVKIIRDIHGYLKASGHKVAYIEQKDASHYDCVNIYQKKGFWNWIFKQKKN